uniref:Uncharacterized protein n=1 Tax=Magallana gigas TaxID=29159 RepID=K1QBK3_MAGGI
MRKREAVVANASLINSICRRTVNDLDCILRELEKFRTFVHPADQNKRKSLIPFGEKRLPESIAGWPCDIRKDFVRFGRCPGNCPAQNRSLPDTGCSIGIKSDSSSGSAGFLYKSKEPTNALGDGFFTAAHVAVKAFEDLFPDKSFRTANLCPEQLRL